MILKGMSKQNTLHYNDVIISTVASQITSLMIVYSTVYSRRRSKKASKLRVTGLCAGNSPVTGEFPTQRPSDAENVFIWWRHHEFGTSNNINTTAHRARHLYFPQLVRRTTIKQYGLVRNRNLLGHDDNILQFFEKKIGESCISVYSIFISRLLCLKHTVT